MIDFLFCESNRKKRRRRQHLSEGGERDPRQIGIGSDPSFYKNNVYQYLAGITVKLTVTISVRIFVCC